MILYTILYYTRYYIILYYFEVYYIILYSHEFIHVCGELGSTRLDYVIRILVKTMTSSQWRTARTAARSASSLDNLAPGGFCLLADPDPRHGPENGFIQQYQVD